MGLRRCFLVVSLVLCFGPGVHAQEMALKLGMQVARHGADWDAIIKPWMDGIVAQSGGRIRFDSRPVHSDAEAAGLFDRVRTGELDVIWAPITPDAKRFKRTEVFELPFMMSNPEASSRALWEYVETYAVDEFKDIRLLGLHLQGAKLLHTSARRITSPDDLNGLHMYCSPRLTSQLLTLLGAEVGQCTEGGQDNPEPAADVDDAYVLDWLETDRSGSARRLRFHTELGPTGALSTSAFMLAINPDVYESLPDDLRRIFDANAGIEISAGFGRRAQQVSAQARDRVAAKGGFDSIRTLPVAEAQAFRKISVKVDQAWVADVTDKGFDGQTLLDGARTLIKKYTR